MKALITGITGQDGSYLAEFLLDKGYKVYGVVRRASSENYERIAHIRDKVELIQADLLDQVSLTEAILATKPDEIYNLAAQSFVPTSWAQPVFDGGVHGHRRFAGARGDSQRSSQGKVLSGVELGDVWKGPTGSSKRGHPFLSAQPLWRR